MENNIEKIKSLNDKSQARLKLPVFFGSFDNYLHGFREILNNAVDEITNNFNDGIINIILDSDNKTITIEDSGRGMRIADKTDGKANYYWLFLKLFAGTKYDDNKQQINSGTNGLGATVVNYTSTLFKVESCYDGNKYIIEFENGGDIKIPLTNLGKTDKHGTKITFRLDDTIYTNTTYDQFELIDIISKISGCSNKITFNFTYNNKTKIFHYDNIQEYFKQNIDEKSFYFQQRTYDNNELSKISLVFNSSLEPIQQVMLNKNYLSEGGTINKGFIEGFRNEANKYAKELGLFQKKEKNIGFEDIENSISFYIDFESSKIEFANQTKFSTKKELYREITKKYIQECLEVFKIEHKDDFKRIVEKILVTKRANEKAEVSRKEIREKLEEGTSSAKTRPEKFVPCRSKNPKEVELILIEGDSALNSIKSSRNSNIMCIYPLKGKIINALKGNINDILANNEVKDIFSILGCGMIYKGKQLKGIPLFNIDNLKVDKILVCNDQDVDGGHIFTLVITLFYVLAPELIKQGKVYSLLTPLYIIKHKKDTIFAYTEKERNNIVKSFNGDKFTETRYKGIGGLSPQVLNNTAMDMNKRKLKCVKWEDVEEGVKIIETCMKEDKINERKEFIENEAYKYFDFSLITD